MVNLRVSGNKLYVDQAEEFIPVFTPLSIPVPQYPNIPPQKPSAKSRAHPRGLEDRHSPRTRQFCKPLPFSLSEGKLGDGAQSIRD